MKSLLGYSLLSLFALIAGCLSALWATGLLRFIEPAGFTDINVENWKSDASIGSSSANPYTRARVARHGLLALSKQEAIYFTRSTDNQNDPLSEHCRYALSGGNQDALWWSITLYDAESRLPLNDDNALSIDATTLGASDKWTAIIAPVHPGSGPWISSRAAGQFDLTLRLYRPAASLLDNPEQFLNAPLLRKIDCEAAS